MSSVILIGALVLVLGACGAEVGDTTTTRQLHTSTTASPFTTVTDPATTTAANSETTKTEALPEGDRQFAFVTELRPEADGLITVVADYAQWLTGDEATKAAIEDGFLEEGETIRDFFIRNKEIRFHELTMQSDVPVVLVACYFPGECVTTARATAEQWMALYNGDNVPELGDTFRWYGETILPYWLTVDGDTVIAVEEQYLP